MVITYARQPTWNFEQGMTSKCHLHFEVLQKYVVERNTLLFGMKQSEMKSIAKEAMESPLCFVDKKQSGANVDQSALHYLNELHGTRAKEPSNKLLAKTWGGNGLVSSVYNSECKPHPGALMWIGIRDQGRRHLLAWFPASAWPMSRVNWDASKSRFPNPCDLLGQGLWTQKATKWETVYGPGVPLEALVSPGEGGWGRRRIEGVSPMEPASGGEVS